MISMRYLLCLLCFSLLLLWVIVVGGFLGFLIVSGLMVGLCT